MRCLGNARADAGALAEEEAFPLVPPDAENDVLNAGAAACSSICPDRRAVAKPGLKDTVALVRHAEKRNHEARNTRSI